MADIEAPSLGLDRHTGGIVRGWDHVAQCLGDIFTTRFGERVMREWYGSMVPALLGETLTATNVIRFFSAISSAIAMWEPRYRITSVTPIEVDRSGHFAFRLEGEYRPRGLLGDYTVEGSRRVVLGVAESGETTINEAA